MPRLLLALAIVCTLTTAAPGQPTVSPERAAALMKVPPGFHVHLVAGEPTLVKPIAMTTDDRGRLWVVESHSYPHWLTDGSAGHDRILIFEDRQGNGHYDCTVFWDRGTNLSGITLGFGGVWLCATPNLLFIPIKPGQDRPAGPPQVVLDGWDLNAKHNVCNTLVWGPDGWLYGCNGILSNARLGQPGTPAAQRVAINCGVWRYHPAAQTVEAFAHGTTNPWGLDFDDYGELFLTNCVIKHLFHVVPGAHFQRMFGQDLNPYCYGLMESCADHIHWAGGDWTTSRGGRGAHNDAGGGHAHAGAMVYLGDNWPDAYRNHLFTCNIHGSRLNQDLLDRQGTAYVAHHGQDFLLANDPWFRGVAVQYGADGAVFVSDWHDTGECHNHDLTQPCGRVFKVTYGQPQPLAVDLAKRADDALVDLQLHKNDWWVRHARRLLQERAAAGQLAPSVRPRLFKMLAQQTDEPRQLRAFWALHAIGALDEPRLLHLLGDQRQPAVLRAWAVRLLVDRPQLSPEATAKLAALAGAERADPVQWQLASALQRLPLAQRWDVAAGLFKNGHSHDDMELLLWYGIEPLVPAAPLRALQLVDHPAGFPIVRQYAARRVASLPDTAHGLDLLVGVLAKTDNDHQRDLLRGMWAALQGRRLAEPAGWQALARDLERSASAEIVEKTRLLSVLFGDRAAIATLRQTVADPRAETAARRTALQTLLDARADDLLPLLRQLLDDRALRDSALRGLAAFNDPGTPALVLQRYSSFTDTEKADAIATLSARPAYALALLAGMERGTVPRRDLSPFTVRQMLNLKDKQVAEQLTRVWGSIRPTAQDKTALMARYLSLVPPKALEKADRSHGRAIFAHICANCHTLFDDGGKIGPNLTGSQRANPEYVLAKVLDPNAVVSRDYQVTVVTTIAGRTLTGLVKEETDKVLTLQTQNEVVRVEKADIEDRQKSALSMMPEGQLAQLSDVEICDLFAYLAGPNQVPLPPRAGIKPGGR